MHTPRPLAVLAVLAVLCLPACTKQEPAPQAADPYVLTTFYPLTYFAQRIAAGKVPIDCPLPAGADPVSWQPDRHDIAAYQAATLILVNGASFEHWLDKVSLPQSRVVDTTRGFADRFLHFATVTHSHGAGGAHTHEGIDGHTWIDPHNAKAQSQAIHDALARAFAKHAAAFAPGLTKLHEDLDALHARFQELTTKLGDTKLLASHPAYNYVAQRYGWKIVNLDLDPDADLSAEAKKSVADAITGASRSILLWESAPNETTASALATLGVRNVVFSPAESITAAELAAGTDYLTLMRRNLDHLDQALR